MRNFRFFCVFASMALVGVACETRIKRGDWSVCDTDYPSCVVGEYCTGENPGAGVEPWRCVMIPAGAVGFECGEVYADEDSPTKMAQVCTRRGVDGDAGTGDTGGGGAGGSGTGMGGVGGMTGTPGCTEKAMCTDADFPHCDTNSGKCVACLMNLDCPVGRPVCDAGICKKCDEKAATDVCSARSATPVCGAKGECVECKSSAECKAEAKPICDVANGVCKGCEGNQECADRGGTAKLCDTVSKRCVSCLTHTDCPAGTPACLPGGLCDACNAGGAAPDACSKRGGGQPVCGPAGLCVECTAAASQACVGGKPVCGNNNECRRCGNDGECTGRGPAVCMDHDDGRCATDAETATVAGGNLQSAIDQVVAGAKKVVVFSGGATAAQFAGPGTLVLVGKGGAAFVKQTSLDANAPAALRFTGGTTYARGFRVTQSPGGILVNGAAFDFRDMSVVENGVGSFGLAKWGGILVNAPGNPAKMRNVSITLNSDNGMVCSAAIDIDTTVTASGNTSGDIAPECRP